MRTAHIASDVIDEIFLFRAPSKSDSPESLLIVEIHLRADFLEFEVDISSWLLKKKARRNIIPLYL